MESHCGMHSLLFEYVAWIEKHAVGTSYLVLTDGKKSRNTMLSTLTITIQQLVFKIWIRYGFKGQSQIFLKITSTSSMLYNSFLYVLKIIMNMSFWSVWTCDRKCEQCTGHGIHLQFKTKLAKAVDNIYKLWAMTSLGK